ncbi:MAG TPA: CHAD domain-containing protein [Hyphomicrobiaceae bacterium]|nr:CHAD domain-containing protein [Hyphomicrobiaceae bacterium]
MAYRLKFNEPLGKGWRRIVREQVELAQEQLGSGHNVDGAVHETRKAMKRVRALLKLLRPGLSSSDYSRENKRYRDIARLLSGARDHAVLMATAETLAKETVGEARAATQAFVARIADDAMSEARDIKPQTVDDGAHNKAARVREAVAALEAAAKSLEKLHFKENSFAVVRAGIARSYRDARADMKEAFKSGVDEDFHAWRKSVQAHWRHILLIDRAWPDLFAARAELAKEISELLGVDHDLFVLIGRAMSLMGPADEAGREAMVGAARARQHELRKQLEIKGATLFAEPTSRFVASVDVYWRAAMKTRKLEKKTCRRDAKAPSPQDAPAKKPTRAALNGRNSTNGKRSTGKNAAPAQDRLMAGAGKASADTAGANASMPKTAAKRRRRAVASRPAKRRSTSGKT